MTQSTLQTADVTDPQSMLRGRRLGAVWFWVVWSICVAILVPLERQRWRQLTEQAAEARWIFYWDGETTGPATVLLLLPLLVLLQRFSKRRRWRSGRSVSIEAGQVNRWVLGGSCCAVFAVSLLSSWAVGNKAVDVSIVPGAGEKTFMSLPPSYHDEYSYLLQADTFRAGRLTWPAAPIRPELFHQFHVLNERRTVSRYFPLTGLWITLTQPLGNLYWGHWLAGGLSAVFFFLTINRIACFRAALLAGLLIAVSPGLAIFSNMLLAHHPTMLALSVFCYAFVRMIHSRQLVAAGMAGFALSMAMLGRPMTAAGFALPFGVWLLAGCVQKRLPRKLIWGFAVPLSCGFLILAALNVAATGSMFRSAYQQYTEQYTPRHRYGFLNGTEQTPTEQPEAIQAYDRWARNLTPALAVANVGQRLVASLQWSLSIFPIMFFAAISLRSLKSDGGVLRRDGRLPFGLIAAAIVSLHVVHVPYWYRGIMDWHYVFETAPLLLLLTACGAVQAYQILQNRLRRRIAFSWCAALLVVGLFPGWFSGGPFAETAKVDAAVSQLAFSRVRFDYFNSVVDSPRIQKPALILVDEAGADPQLSFIINDPAYQSDVLVCRHPNELAELQELAEAFDDRHLYSFDPQLKRFPVFQQIERPLPQDDPEPADE